MMAYVGWLKLAHVGSRGLMFAQVGTCWLMWAHVGTCWHMCAHVGSCCMLAHVGSCWLIFVLRSSRKEGCSVWEDGKCGFPPSAPCPLTPLLCKGKRSLTRVSQLPPPHNPAKSAMSVKMVSSWPSSEVRGHFGGSVRRCFVLPSTEEV
jgi:hypothetical protein